MSQQSADYQKNRQMWRMAVRQDKRLTEGQRLILTALDEFRNSIRGDAYPTNTTLGNACGLSRQTANGALKKAEELGYLVAAKRPRRSDGRQAPVVWKFLIPKNQSQAPLTLEGPESSTVDTGTGSRVKQRSVPESSSVDREPLNEPLNKDKPVILTEDQKRMLGFYS